jgi:endonuclease/exonuclease/phosphatase family metal-dependent hydrolase
MTTSSPGVRTTLIRLSLTLVVLAATLLGGCVGPYAVTPRTTVPVAPVAWFSPIAENDVRALDRWRSGVGEPIVPVPASASDIAADEVTLISWNVAVGDGDIGRLVRGLDTRKPIVLLLQEAYRAGAAVPRRVTPLTAYAGRLGGRDPGRIDVQAVASRLGLQVYYVPSMRNGAPALTDEDRGNAILSNLPLTDLTAIELPFERQRRVAVAATVAGTSSRGMPWRLRVVSAHLDNMIGVERLLASGGEVARARQTRGLLSALNGQAAPLVLGGDFNSWFGFSDRAYTETAKAFPQTAVTDRRPTFRGLLRLDHLFFRLPDGWRAEFHRGDARFGSDHYPLIASIEIK